MNCKIAATTLKTQAASTADVITHRPFSSEPTRRCSVALLHWLTNLGYENLIVCHLNHQLRGRSSDADARFVKNLAGKYELDFEAGAANVRAFAKKKKTSVETTAREVRYSFFAKDAKRHGCHTIFLANHADDLVET